MKTLILAGGLGTRLQSKVSDVPKSMAPVAGRPFLEWQLMALRVQGFTDIVLCTGYKSDRITDYFADGLKLGINIAYSIEPEPLGTAGAILNAARYIDDAFLLLNGDTFFDMDYQGLVEFHEAKEAQMTLSLTMVDNASRYGSVAVDINGRVSRFNEKQLNSTGIGYINAGVYVMDRSILELISSQQAFSLEKDVIPTIINKGTVCGFISDGYFIDIGTPESYEAAQSFFAQFS